MLLSAVLAAALVAVFDDALPGQDREVNQALVTSLRTKGFSVETLSADTVSSLSVDRHAAFVLPSCEAVPRSVAAAALAFARNGGPTLFTGGPLLDRQVFRRGTHWLTAEDIAAERAAAPRGFRPPAFREGFAEQRWRRSRDARAADGGFFRRDGGELHLSTCPLTGWDVFFTRISGPLYGTGETLFSFTAKADSPDTRLAIEMIEADGSRWIATPAISTNWARVVLQPADFRYWHDSRAKGRGGPTDRFRPSAAREIGFGFSGSHTPGMVGRAGSVRFREVASCRDPFADAPEEKAPALPHQDGVYPRYKTMPVGDAVCAVPRPLGEGCGQNVCWRFLPLRTVQDADGGAGAAEWILLERRPDQPPRVLAGFGCKSAAFRRSAARARLAETVDRLVNGSLLLEGGTDRFVYFAGERVTLGASWRGPAGAAAAEVRDHAGKTVFATTVSPCAQKRAATVCAGALPVGTYRAAVRVDGDEIAHEFAVLSGVADPAADFITVRDGDFRLKGRKWSPVGVNFWPLYVSGMNHSDYWSGWMRGENYAPSLVERDLAHFAEMGGTMISIQAPPVEHVRNLLDVLRRCRRHGIYVNLFLPWASPLAFREEEGAAYLNAGRLAGNATIMAYDTIWEPGNHVFKDDAARARWDGAWRRWIDEQYGSVTRAEKDWGVPARRNAKGEVVGPDSRWFCEDGPWRVMLAAYRRFMDNATSRAWNDGTRRLRALDSNHLISFRQGNTLPYDFALTGPVRHIDFICPEGYAVPDSDAGEDAIGWITRYVKTTTGGKPVVWSEFGRNVWDAERMEPSPAVVLSQGRYSERFYRGALRAGANGTVPWWWPGGYRVGEKSDYGILSPSGAERPSARLIRRYGPRFKTARQARPTAWMDYDRDVHAGGYWRTAFHEGAAAYGAAQRAGRLLGIRLKGMDADSGTCPRTAVGGVPCDGTNPPQALDAEFDLCETRRTEAGVTVHARLGNVGAAAWRADDVRLVARDADGHVAAHVPLTTRVPRLGATETLALPLPGAGVFRLRLEVKDWCPFGETRTVDAEKVK